MRNKIYHHKQAVFLDHKKVLSKIEIDKNNIKCFFYEPSGSNIIKSLKQEIENTLFKISWVKSVEIGIELNDSKNKTKHEKKIISK